MQWNTDARQDSRIQSQPDSYDGYVGLSQQRPHTHEYQQNEQGNTFQQQEYQHGFEQASYVQQQQVESALSLNYTSLAAILCYSIGWLTGLLFLLFVRENRFVRFHALQSLIFFGGINLIDIALLRIGMIHVRPLSAFIVLFFMLLNFVAFVGWVVAIIQASRGQYYRLPFVGNLVAGYINRNVTLK
jgi:uncharacterized membrane protein